MKMLKTFAMIIMIIALTVNISGCGSNNESNTEASQSINVTIVSDPDKQEDEVKNDTITIVLDPGHGGENTGAKADVNGDGVIDLEKDLNMVVANHMIKILDNYEGLHVALTRYGDDELSHAQRAAIAKSFAKETLSKTVILISIHNNANPYAQLEGVEAYVSVYDERYDWIATDLAYEMVDNIAENFELLNRGVLTRVSRRHDDWYGIIRNGIARDIPTIILEQCFMDNPKDALKVLSSDEKLYKLAETNANAIIRFFSLELKEGINEKIILE
ncbi:MAG: N-acetylmuramoyl-L-alanine amidase [Eubacteriales bacterium]|nr:N-acetylmuramoyl-L-alanine amidase [Eubacteriales bacterium]